MAVQHGKSRANYRIAPKKVTPAKGAQAVDPEFGNAEGLGEDQGEPAEAPMGAAMKPRRRMPMGNRFQKKGSKRGSQDMGS